MTAITSRPMCPMCPTLSHLSHLSHAGQRDTGTPGQLLTRARIKME